MKQKTILDYYELIFEKYPTISLSDIKKILLFGWKSLYLFNSLGGDVTLKQQDMMCYIGSLMNNSVRWFYYYRKKMKVKLRIMYKRKKIKWDGYYYFALTKNLYDNYLALKNSKGRPRKNFIFDKIIMYKLFDECNIIWSNAYAIFKIPSSWDRGFTFYYPKLKTAEAELVLTREPLKFKDVLLSGNNYEFLSDSLNKYKRRNG